MNFNTTKKRLAWLSKRGNIVTLKTHIHLSDGRKLRQLIVDHLQDKDGFYRIIGTHYNSNIYTNLRKLVEAIDWEWMEQNTEV